jgi:uncharacterized damage-inducible protein DinB
MSLGEYFRMLARYNRIANESLYRACANLDPGEYREQRAGSFGSIHALLNHILLGDRVWMARFHGGGATTPALHAVIAEEFDLLRRARTELDAEIETFFSKLDPGFFSRSFRYVNNQGRDYTEDPTVAVAHFFNHQTHHRGQVHGMLSQTPVAPPPLDLHRILNP